MLASRRSVDDENSRWRLRILLARFRRGKALARLQPLQGQLDGRVRESRPGSGVARRLAIFDVAVPRLFEHLLELAGDAGEGRIVEPGEKAPAKFVLGDRDVLVLPSNIGFRHADLFSQRTRELESWKLEVRS